MAQRTFQFSLKDPMYPMLSEKQGRTVINPIRGEVPELPSLAYMHNVMPTKEGYQSVELGSNLTNISGPTTTDVRHVRVIYGLDGLRYHLLFLGTGRMYILRPGGLVWLDLPDTTPTTVVSDFDPNDVTVGTVGGISYIWFSVQKLCFTFDGDQLDAAIDMIQVTLTGLTAADVLGVAAASGYLIAYTRFDIAWSSTIDPLDFVPSQITGAGGGSVEDTDGAIQFILSMGDGLIIYCVANALSVTYTGNDRFPWKFKPIPGAAGGTNLELVAYEARSPIQFAYTNAGLQSIIPTLAEVILPEVTDFLAGQLIEDFNTGTLVYDITDTDTGGGAFEKLLKKVKLIGSRYLVISYGVTEFTHALIFDLGLQKLGKIKFTHVDIIDFIRQGGIPGLRFEEPKQNLGFVTETGAVFTVDFGRLRQSTNEGVLILGKLQHSRRSMITLEEVEIENTQTDDPVSIRVLAQTTLDGKNFTTVEGVIATDVSDPVAKYRFHVTGRNHSIVILGGFDLVTAQVTYVEAGDR